MIIKPELPAADAQACLDLMREGLRELLRGPDPEGAINAYCRVRDALLAGKPAEQASESSVKRTRKVR